MQRPLQTALSLSAIALWLACVLACRAAWSPDGSKVLFPFFLPDDMGVAIALHDVKAGTTRTLRTFERGGGKGKGGLSLRWMADGKRALAIGLETAGPDRLAVFTMDCVKGEILKEYPLGKPAETGKPDEANLLVPPALFRDRYALLTEKNALVRLDLETGEVKRVERQGGDLIITVLGAQAFYCREMEHEDRYEIGTLDPNSLALSSMLSFTRKEHGHALMLAAFEASSGRVAFVSEFEERAHLLVFRGGKLEQKKPFDPPGPAGKAKLFDTAWAPGGKSVFVSYAIQRESMEVGIAEVPLDGAGPRLQPLLRLEKESKGPLLLLSLAPDGKTLAALATMLDEKTVDPARPVLFLVDLASRKVTEVRAPPVGAASGKRGEPEPRKKDG